MLPNHQATPAAHLKFATGLVLDRHALVLIYVQYLSRYRDSTVMQRVSARASAGKLRAKNSFQNLLQRFQQIPSSFRRRKRDRVPADPRASGSTSAPVNESEAQLVTANEPEIQVVAAPYCPFERFPDELLLHLFDYVHYNAFSRIRPDTLARWLRLCHVCTRWRYIIISEARLWRVIPVCRDFKALQLFLPLRGNVPMELHFTSLDSIPSPVELLRPHCTSIRLLKLCYREPDSLNSESPAQRILSLDLPALEDLCVWSETTTTWYERPRELPVSLGRFPSLRHLKLHHFIVPANLTGLRTLKLHSWQCSLPFDQFIDMLHQCSALVELHLCRSSYSAFPPWTLPNHWRPDTVRSVEMRHLENLRIIDEALDVMLVILMTIRAPSMASLHLTRKYVNMDIWREPDGKFPTHLRVFKNMVPSPGEVTASIPEFGDNPVSARVSVRGSMCTLSLSSAQPHKRIHLAARVDRRWNRALSAALEDLTYLFPKSHITALSVEGPSYNVSPSDWAEVFSELPHLQTLELSGSGTWTAMWYGLARTKLERRFLEWGPPAPGRLPENRCPKLTAVRIRYVPRPGDNYPAPPDERDIDIMRGVLCQRAAWDMELEELTWAVHSSRHADYDAARITFLARLSSLVRNVRYEDLDGGE